jgi:hypothetical protein
MTGPVVAHQLLRNPPEALTATRRSSGIFGLRLYQIAHGAAISMVTGWPVSWLWATR